MESTPEIYRLYVIGHLSTFGSLRWPGCTMARKKIADCGRACLMTHGPITTVCLVFQNEIL